MTLHEGTLTLLTALLLTHLSHSVPGWMGSICDTGVVSTVAVAAAARLLALSFSSWTAFWAYLGQHIYLYTSTYHAHVQNRGASQVNLLKNNKEASRSVWEAQKDPPRSNWKPSGGWTKSYAFVLQCTYSHNVWGKPDKINRQGLKDIKSGIVSSSVFFNVHSHYLLRFKQTSDCVSCVKLIVEVFIALCVLFTTALSG